MVIMGIDPGTATTGFGIIKTTGKNIVCLDYGAIETKKEKTDSQRLSEIYKKTNHIIKKYSPDLVLVEKIYFFKNSKTIISVSQARGVILLAINKKKVAVSELTPLEVKLSITGYGKATKRQVQESVKKILGLKKIPRPDDAADALAIAIVGSKLKELKM